MNFFRELQEIPAPKGWKETKDQRSAASHACFALLCFLFNPLRPNGDQHQISPCNINACSTPEVMRIKDMISKGEFS